ncbi:hypothetical protein BZA05DRAFT_196648 [Tricharina praecox]|uniref:uncharacterized protein n=1 Tax=Tricharina praecox TaxID=43433 RepID=UPI002220CAAC|nr:uncharacterized protein BZA05DRAFT_196648 [Tricharina praecox]KAI5856251.1 hypothetical protein BZA05DRAFT_196648 [Tricharina praecox]
MVSPRRRSSRARSTTHQIAASSSSSSSSSRNRISRHRPDEDTLVDLDSTFQRVPDADIDEANDDSHTAESVVDEAMEDAGDAEDEITRCICGFQEYQGGDDETDTDGLFIQCDQCKVWQHGFCVGITDNESTPENYYCEKCKPELHREGFNKAGHKTSVYLPAQEEPPKPTAKEVSHKRRTTMNSRDAEYDDEVLKRMLEVSKHETKTNGDSGSRRGRKRGSSEGSDEMKDPKRSRHSDTPESQSNAIVDSSDEKPAKGPVNPPPSARKARAAANRNASSNNVTSAKRTSTRNRGGIEKFEPRKDDSEHSDDYAPRKNSRSTHRSVVEEPVEPTPVVQAEPVVPDTPQQTTKRAARNSNINGGRRRNGRHTRQSEDPHETGVPMARAESSTSHVKHDNTASVLEKPTKPRLPAARITMNEMKKRVNSISEYITRTQVEMANTRQSDIYAYLAWMEEQGTPVSKSKSSTATPKSASPRSATASSNTVSDPSIPKIQINGGGGTSKVLDKAAEALSANANALEIMELLSTKINRWQQNHGEVL